MTAALPELEELALPGLEKLRAAPRRLIAATCLLGGAPLVTKDEVLRAMPTLQPIW